MGLKLNRRKDSSHRAQSKIHSFRICIRIRIRISIPHLHSGSSAMNRKKALGPLLLLLNISPLSFLWHLRLDSA
ncbi:uncharacterized protein UDID_18826 [Ustilago sp. UG-2017a]|nr:uncharacterized protein UDID_18826 [Ustilago sp. UG-2017a]